VRIKELGATLRGEYVEQLEKGKDQRVAYLDNAGLGKEIVVRSRQAGDRFSPLGVKGTKKLQDFFVDEKIPQGERDRIPIVESGGKIIWVAGRRIDERARVSETTRRIVKLQLL
jgi:tRNA(Ile)-lysidine synthase